MTSKIFINYRRGDDPGSAGRLFDRLEQAFAPDELFMDVDNIAPGLDFVDVLDQQVAQCDIFLAVIGRGWLQSTDTAGQRRLDDPADFVRIEIESALKRSKRVIPVLVTDAQMPRADELPESLTPLARRHAVRLSHENFGADSARLIRDLKSALAEEAEKREQAEAEAQRQAEEERRRAARERREAEAEAQRQAEEERRQHEAEERRREEAEARRQVEEEQPPKPQPPRQKPSPPSVAPATAFRDVEEPWCPEMVVIPAGQFLMGSPEGEGRDNEHPQHEVVFAQPFALGRFPVTFDEYDRFCEQKGREQAGDEGWGRGRRPVIVVSWEDAQAYCKWLSEVAKESYRLPSEAEWEYACRAGTTTAYAFGDKITEKQANFGQKMQKTSEVGSYPANAWGLHDMHGNVWEWVEDCWNESYEGAPTDGTSWLQGNCDLRVVRGGSWDLIPENLRSAYRYGHVPDLRDLHGGFRLARAFTP